MAKWVRKPCKICGGETRKVRGSRYCEEHTLSLRSEWMRRAYLCDPEAHKRRSRLAYIKRKYGMTEEQYELLKDRPCDICGEKKKRMHIDHLIDGTWRGWLCHECNPALGLFKDNPALLRAAAKYIERGGSNVI